MLGRLRQILANGRARALTIAGAAALGLIAVAASQAATVGVGLLKVRLGGHHGQGAVRRGL
jgi:hypothetical protein